MKTLCIIQARMGSSRLAGKVLRPLGNRTVLGNVIHRINKCNVDGVIVATTTNPIDKPVIMDAINNGAQYFTGSEDNVLERYYKAAKFFGADRILRTTADCPLIMPDIVNELLETGKRFNYSSNVQKRTYPKGFDCEVFTMDELTRAYKCAKTKCEKEHVTPYIINHAMCKYSLEDNEDFSDIRITLDTEKDYADLTNLYKHIGEVYNYAEVKEFLRKEKEQYFNSGNLVG
jgi:spore coat polysaccharide biosynthesis protein SpsF